MNPAAPAPASAFLPPVFDEFLPLSYLANGFPVSGTTRVQVVRQGPDGHSYPPTADPQWP